MHYCELGLLISILMYAAKCSEDLCCNSVSSKSLVLLIFNEKSHMKSAKLVSKVQK